MEKCDREAADTEACPAALSRTLPEVAMPLLRRALAALTMGLVAIACSRTVRQGQYQPVAEDGVLSNGGHTVIGREALARSDIPVLELLRYRVPGMRVNPTDDCPEVILRGKSTFITNSSAAIYVDGERAANTCVLSMLSTFHLARVEVYPGGVPPTGYMTDPYGVILLFSKKGPDPE